MFDGTKALEYLTLTDTETVEYKYNINTRQTQIQDAKYNTSHGVCRNIFKRKRFPTCMSPGYRQSCLNVPAR